MALASKKQKQETVPHGPAPNPLHPTAPRPASRQAPHLQAAFVRDCRLEGGGERGCDGPEDDSKARVEAPR